MNVFEEKIHALRVEKATRNRELCEKRNEMFREIDGHIRYLLTLEKTEEMESVIGCLEKCNQILWANTMSKLDKNQNSYKRTVNWMIDQMVEFYKEQV